MIKQLKTNLYNPVEFIKRHTEKILPENSILVNIKFSGFKNKLFHSGDRPGGKLTIKYLNPSGEKKLQLFVKQHSDAVKVFNQMSYIHGNLSTFSMDIHMPKPYMCDYPNNVTYMEFVSGTALTYKVLGELLLQRANYLTDLFYEIGNWLNCYHQTTRLNKVISISDIKSTVSAGLDKSSYFNSLEKKIINNTIERLNFDNTNLTLVKPHNDFALRNIIYKKSIDFKVIDWDAMFHKKFTTESSIWNDITSFITHINSMQRFSPVITSKQTKILAKSFLRGYFTNIENPYQDNDIQNHLYLFTLCYYLGVIGDRALPVIFKGNFGYRFTKNLHQLLLNGLT
jgi:hypothetical protein